MTLEGDVHAGGLIFFDDAKARTFEPFALSRPFCEMRVGALLARERWEFAFGLQSTGFISAPHLEQFAEQGAPPECGDVLPAGSIVVNSRATIGITAGAGDMLRVHARAGAASAERAWTIAGRIAAVELTSDISTAAFASTNPFSSAPLSDDARSEVYSLAEVDGVWIDEVWDVIRHLTTLLSADIPIIAKARSFANVSSNNNGPIVTGRYPLFVEDGATVEPFTFFETTAGPILVRAGSTVQAFTRVIGPCYIGRDCVITADRIAGSAIGDTCRVHGELSSTVFIGQSNKGHDGFVGHSIVGRWVNMGAGTTTSNLKNTYGTVSLWTPHGLQDTGLQFLGTLFGDHVKTGIGLQLTTGCVLGAAANVFNSMPPKVVEPFAWGSNAPYESYAIDKFIDAAERMMSRRNVGMTDAGRAYLRAVHDARWSTRSR